jgi:Mg2+-importing ATPase
VLVVRSRRPFFKSRPSQLLILATATIVLVTALTPYLPFAGVLGFQPMPARFYPIIALIVVAYIVAAELAKLLFYRTNRRSLFAKTYACDINE